MIVRASSSFKMELPFELSKNHKINTKCRWKKRGLIITDEEFEVIYQQYIYSTNCELCEKVYKSNRDRHMEHNHDTGEFRNICCNSCNSRKRDVKVRTDNKSGYRFILKSKCSTTNQGFIWRFRVTINGNYKTIKSSTNLEKLIKFRDEWLEKNEYFK